MRNTYKAATIVLMIISGLFFSLSLSGAVYLNDPPPRDMNDSIIDGTSLFLQANASVNLLLNEVEIAEKETFNFENALLHVNSAIEKLQTAKSEYLKAVDIGRNTALDQDTVNYYKQFDYKGFAQLNQLNGEIMAEVSMFLQKGDINGVVIKNILEIDNILSLLEQIKAQLSNGIKPEIGVFWTLFQKYNSLGLFGNYATLVFNNVRASGAALQLMVTLTK